MLITMYCDNCLVTKGQAVVKQVDTNRFPTIGQNPITAQINCTDCGLYWQHTALPGYYC